MKKTTYILGLASGVVLAFNWKLIVKESVKMGVKVGRGIKKVSAETLEDLEDASAEAMHDLAEEDRAKETAPAGSRRRAGAAVV
jgi:hypothetical protein